MYRLYTYTLIAQEVICKINKNESASNFIVVDTVIKITKMNFLPIFFTKISANNFLHIFQILCFSCTFFCNSYFIRFLFLYLYKLCFLNLGKFIYECCIFNMTDLSYFFYDDFPPNKLIGYAREM